MDLASPHVVDAGICSEQLSNEGFFRDFHHFRTEKVIAFYLRDILLFWCFLSNQGVICHCKHENLFETYIWKKKRMGLSLPSARLTLHSTKLCTNFKFFREEKNLFGTKVTSEAFLSIFQNLKVTRLQGGTQTKLWTCWRNWSFEVIWGFFGARSRLCCAPVDGLTKTVV